MKAKHPDIISHLEGGQHIQSLIIASVDNNTSLWMILHGASRFLKLYGCFGNQAGTNH